MTDKCWGCGKDLRHDQMPYCIMCKRNRKESEY